MVKFYCVECGIEWESKVNRYGPRRCKPCAEKARKEGRGPVQAHAAANSIVRDVVGVRDLKANPAEIIKMLEETPGLEVIITRYGKPTAKLVSLAGDAGGVPWHEKKSLRGTWSHLPELSDADFDEAKMIWNPKTDA